MLQIMKELIVQWLPYIELTLSVVLIASVIMQQTGASLGGAFGADNFSSTFHKRRGFEKFLFQLTIAVAVLLAVSALANLILVK